MEQISLKLVLGLAVFVLLGLRLALGTRSYQQLSNVPMPLMVLADTSLLMVAVVALEM